MCCDVEIRIRRATEHSLVVKQYITLCHKDEWASRRDWSAFIKGPISKVQRMMDSRRWGFPRLYKTSEAASHEGAKGQDRAIPPNPYPIPPVFVYNPQPFLELFADMKAKMKDEIYSQPVKYFMERLDISPTVIGWKPGMIDTKKGLIRKKGDLLFVEDNVRGLTELHVVILNDYLLLTKKVHTGSEKPTETDLNLESYRTRYKLNQDVGVL